MAIMPSAIVLIFPSLRSPPPAAVFTPKKATIPLQINLEHKMTLLSENRTLISENFLDNSQDLLCLWQIPRSKTAKLALKIRWKLKIAVLLSPVITL